MSVRGTVPLKFLTDTTDDEQQTMFANSPSPSMKSESVTSATRRKNGAGKYTLYNPSPDTPAVNSSIQQPSSDALDAFSQQRVLESAPQPRGKRTLFHPDQALPPLPPPSAPASHMSFHNEIIPPTTAPASTVVDIASTPPISPQLANTRSFQEAINAHRAVSQPTHTQAQLVDPFPLPPHRVRRSGTTSPSDTSPAESMPGSTVLPSRALRARVLQRELPRDLNYEHEASILSSLVSNQPSSLFSPLASPAEGYGGFSSTEVSHNSLDSFASTGYLPGQMNEWESRRSSYNLVSPNPLSVRNNVKAFDFGGAANPNQNDSIHASLNQRSSAPSQDRLRMNKSMSEGPSIVNTPSEISREVLSSRPRQQQESLFQPSKAKYSLFRPNSVEPIMQRQSDDGLNQLTSPMSGPIAGRRANKHTLFHPIDSPYSYASHSITPTPPTSNPNRQQKKGKHTLFKPSGEFANQQFF